jgi:hypothetical protein
VDALVDEFGSKGRGGMGGEDEDGVVSHGPAGDREDDINVVGFGIVESQPVVCGGSVAGRVSGIESMRIDGVGDAFMFAEEEPESAGKRVWMRVIVDREGGEVC